MLYGPCGGVRGDLGCEVDGRRCPFVDLDLARWPSADHPAAAPAVDERDSPLVVVDIRPAEATLESARSIAAAYEGWADTVLVGDHHGRVELPGPVLARELMETGLRPWVTLSCRDRNSVALESDLVALRELGVDVAHCVTGDARAPHVRVGSEPVFELDSLRLTALASSLGMAVSVAESPGAPPERLRALRAIDKHAAGASWCFVNVGVEEDRLREFVATVNAGAPAMRCVVCVPVVTDAASAARLASLPGVHIDAAVVAAIDSAPDPAEAIVDATVAAAQRALSIEGVAGVNLSGPSVTVAADERAALMREIVLRLS
jgi:5,10-methylenetetrahydrofolate reductase